MKGEAFLKMFAGRPPFSKMHPRMALFFKEYLSREKIIRFGDKYVLNTHFPPYPSPAFDNLVNNFFEVGQAGRRLFSVTLAVTNRCTYRCWHCYNANRSRRDLSLPVLRGIVRRLQDLGAANVTLSGGEPLLRRDLEEIVASFDERTSLTLNTTGNGLTPQRASALRKAGLFAFGVSVDSSAAEEHDQLRGRKGAFRTALDALGMASAAGIYPYIISLATREFLEPGRFQAFMRFAADAGALEVHLLEPSATGRLAGNKSVCLGEKERSVILQYQREVAEDAGLPILSTFAYLESSSAFGCGAGLTHLYIDGSGEVCPCNLVPLSFGNAGREPLDGILDRMGRFFRRPRPTCVGRILAPHIKGPTMPLTPQASRDLCRARLPSRHGRPLFFRLRDSSAGEVGPAELRNAYDGIHRHYDEFWLKEAAKPVDRLIARLPLSGPERIFEAGCGTGYATVLLASRINNGRNLLAADLSEGMLKEAKVRARSRGFKDIRFFRGDALAKLRAMNSLDLVFSSWVLGYIPLKPFFEAAGGALKKGGRLAFIVHKENSPYEPLRIFNSLVLENPAALVKRVAFDFPPGVAEVRRKLALAGLEATYCREGKVVFRYKTATQALEHLKKSGAGTAYYEAVAPAERNRLAARFLERLRERHKGGKGYEVIHDYIACVARKI